MNLTIVNPSNGRETEYDSRYLQSEARRLAKSERVKLVRWFVRVVENGTVSLVVHYLRAGIPGSIQSAI
jgi:hypothetical protein